MVHYIFNEPCRVVATYRFHDGSNRIAYLYKSERIREVLKTTDEFCYMCSALNKPLAVLDGRIVYAGDILYDMYGVKLRAMSPLTDEFPLRMEIINRRHRDPVWWATDTHWNGTQVLFRTPQSRSRRTIYDCTTYDCL
jgi:hypothetical protein